MSLHEEILSLIENERIDWDALTDAIEKRAEEIRRIVLFQIEHGWAVGPQVDHDSLIRSVGDLQLALGAIRWMLAR